MKRAVIAILLSFAAGTVYAGHHDHQFVYLGQGRYACNGSDCGRFNAYKSRHDWDDIRKRDEERNYEYERQLRFSDRLEDEHLDNNSDYGGDR